MSDITISIADDSQIFTSLLAKSINSNNGYKVLFVADNGVDLLKKLSTIGKPDIILMDISMPLMDGIVATKNVKTLYPRIKIIIQTQFGNKNFFHKLIKEKVEGYVTKAISMEGLFIAIDRVYNGEIYYKVDNLGESLRLERQIYMLHTEINADGQFTEREDQVLRLLFKSYSTKEISKELSITERTVETHRNNMIKKTNSKNTLDLVLNVFLR